MTVQFGTQNKTDKLSVYSKLDPNDKFEIEITKQRPHDFDEEILELQRMLNEAHSPSYQLETPSGLDTAFVAAAAMMSAVDSKVVFLSLEDYKVEK